MIHLLILSIILASSMSLGQTDKAHLLELDKSNPYNSSVLLNLGIIALKENRPGAAIGLWRKGLSQNANDKKLNDAIAWGKTKLEKAEARGDFDTWENWRQLVILKVPPLPVVIFSSLLLLVSGWILIRWWGRRRKVLAGLTDDPNLPSVPYFGLLLSLLFCFSFVLVISLFIDRLEVRGTLLMKKTDVKSAPEEAATTLFEAFEGSEVIVLDAKNNWRQVQIPGGHSGWIPEDAVFATSDLSERAFR